jgi:hypothetical protein
MLCVPEGFDSDSVEGIVVEEGQGWSIRGGNAKATQKTQKTQ